MTITRVDLALAAGETVRIQGGNQLFVYSLTGASSLGIVFYHPNGQRMGPEGEFPVGVRYGPGQSRPNGAPFWQWAEVTNNSASVAAATVFIAESVIDMSAVSPNVTVASGSVDADAYTGNRNGAWASAETGPNAAAYGDALDFHVTVQAGAVAAGTGCFIAQVLAENGGSASYPKAVLIDEVSAHCDQAGWRLFGYGLISVAFPSGSVTPAAQFMADHGGANDVFPASAGSGNRNWVRSSTSPTVPAGNKADIFRGGAADQLYRHEFKRPIVCERVGSSDYGSRYFAVQNTSGSPALVTMTLRGRVIAS